MALMRVEFKVAAATPERRPSLPRSGACAVALPDWHPHDVIMLGGYTEDGAESGTPARRRAVTMEAWAFSSADGGNWDPVQYAQDGPMPQPRLTFQAAVLGENLWIVGGWDPSAPQGEAQFLNDVWTLNLRTYRWKRVEVVGEEMPRISRFALAALPGGRLLIHTHRSAEDVLVLDTAPAEPAQEGASASGAAAPEDQGPQPYRATLQRIAVRGVFPGDQSPPSRGLHSLTAAAAPRPATSGSTAAAAGASPVAGGGPPGAALYVFGGAPQSGPMYGDLWALDLESMTWQELNPEGEKPQARCSHVAAACGAAAAAAPGGGTWGRYLLIMGGSYYAQSGGLQPLDDVLVYDTQENRWIGVEVEGPRPSARNAAVMVRLRGSAAPASSLSSAGVPTGGDAPASGGPASSERFVLHGGWRPFVESYNDTYVVTVTLSS